MWGVWSSRTFVIGGAAAIFAIVCVLPMASMLWGVATAAAPISLLQSAFLDARQRRLLATTISLGLSTAALSAAAGMLLGFVLARTRVPARAALRIALVAPALLPPYVIALAWTSIAGAAAFTLFGAVVSLTTAYFPIAMLATEVGLRRVDPRLEEAALLVTTPRRVLRRISGPLVLPNVIAAALLIFVLAVSEFSVPGVLRVRVFTTEVFSAFAALYDFARATVLSLPLMLVSCAAAWAATGSGKGLIVTRRSLRHVTTDAFDGWSAAGTVLASAGIVVALIVPVSALLIEAVRAQSVLAVMRSSRDAATNSLLLASLGATAVTIVALVLGYARARTTRRVGVVLDVCWLMLFAVPSTVMGIGLIGVWNRAGAAGFVYGTRAMLLLATLSRFVPAGALAAAAIVRAVPDSHEEAAATAGAGWLRTMNRIVLPQIRTGLLAVWVVTFILAFGEVGAGILVAPPGESTLPIRVYTMTANAPPGHVAALALFQCLVVFCPLALLGFVLARQERS